MTGGAESADLAALARLAGWARDFVPALEEYYQAPPFPTEGGGLCKTAAKYIEDLATALEALAAENARLREARAAVLEEAAKECERHAEFCRDEAHKGGNWKHLKARMDEAAYNAKRIRALAALPASGQKD